ncbi:MAG: PaREP1 family protein [Candidatus Methanomethylicia archaeon]
MSNSDVLIATAEEVLKYAEEEFEKAIKLGDMLLYRNAADKVFLSIVIAVNSYVNRKLNIIPKSHSERRSLLRKMEREDLRAAYSDLMKTLHEEAFYEGIYNPEEVKYAISLARKILKEIKNSF